MPGPQKPYVWPPGKRSYRREGAVPTPRWGHVQNAHMLHVLNMTPCPDRAAGQRWSSNSSALVGGTPDFPSSSKAEEAPPVGEPNLSAGPPDLPPISVFP